jgi:hypothetical protein
MSRSYAPAALAFSLLISGAAARAGIEPGVLLTRSPQLELAVSHVVVGRLEGYRKVGGVAGRYLADVTVRQVEKGAGVRPGDRLLVAFTSPWTLDQLRRYRGGGGDCGDRQYLPVPGDLFRLYTTPDKAGGFVADHPQSFFAFESMTTRGEPERTSGVAWLLVAACLMAAAAGRWMRRPRGPREGVRLATSDTQNDARVRPAA